MADDLVELIVPPGADEYPISHGQVEYSSYRVDAKDPASGWRVLVAREHAKYFINNGGFKMAQTISVPDSAGTTPVMYPDGHKFSIGVDYRGIGLSVESYDRGDGVHVADVPVESLVHVVAHGLVPAPQEPGKPVDDDTMPSPRAAVPKKPAHLYGSEVSGVAALSSDAQAEIKEAKAAEKSAALEADPKGTPHPDVPSDKEWDGLTGDHPAPAKPKGR